jgi:mono/diheme cytochrome c family protein
MRSVLSHYCLLGLTLALFVSPSLGGDTPTDAVQSDFFEKSVRPVLAANCQECHGATKHKAGLRLDSRAAILSGGDSGPAAVSGKPEESLLISAVRYNATPRMPPKHRLSNAEIEALADWIKHGLSWPEAKVPVRVAATEGRKITEKDREFWSFRPIANPPLPRVHDTSWPKRSLDFFVLGELETRGLHPVELADRLTLIRRATFDLIGLPPTVEEVEAFLHDGRPDAFARVVDRLLASPQYGERWGRHWLDVARYGEDQAHTFEARLYPCGYRYRDWVVQALNRDMPYDEFLREQIAGDLEEEPGRQERLAALGFFALGPVYYGDRQKFDQLDDRIDTLSRGVLGLTVACARCHDHKFDPIPTRDYYALAGVFASTDYVDFPLGPPAEAEAYKKAVAAVAKQRKAIEQFIAMEKARAAKATDKKNATAAAMSAETRKKLSALRAELEKLQKKVPAKYPVIHTLADDPHPRNLHVCLRGNPENLGVEAPRHFLSVLSGESLQHGSGRRELADTIASKDNPLTARVMVNRVWQHHFGKGLVRTPSNFGALGERPTHPQLLDHLSRRFIDGGWSIKGLHRAILLSATYQMSSRFDPADYEKDPDNRYYWRMNRRRLEVEPWRDALLAVSGRFDSTVGGPSVDLASASNRRRTLYAKVSRHELNSLLRLFDFPDPNLTCAERTTATVPLQQLFVLNSEFMVQNAKALAARLFNGPEKDDAARIRRAYQLLYGRPAAESEVRLGMGFLTEQVRGRKNGTALSPWEEYAQALLSANEFLYVD